MTVYVNYWEASNYFYNFYECTSTHTHAHVTHAHMPARAHEHTHTHAHACAHTAAKITQQIRALRTQT